MKPSITVDEFAALAAKYSVVPVSIEILGDRETPVSVYEKLVAGKDGFLLESVEGGEQWARWSFVGWESQVSVESREGVTSVRAESVKVPDVSDLDPLQALESLLGSFTSPPDEALGFGGEVPPLHAGAVGYLGYDIVRYVESLPNRPPDDRHLPEMAWQFFGMLAVVDRFRQTIRLIRNVFVGDDPADAYAAAVADLETTAAKLGEPTAYGVRRRPDFDSAPEPSANMTREQFEAAVERAIKYIEAGDAFQIVPSLRLEVDFAGDSFEVYRALRLVNPSPFLFYLRHGDVAISGASPELMTRARDGKADSRPIAGTRPRGKTHEEDIALGEELLADPKERAEHVMLIDLARNDLGRVSEFGIVEVEDLMVIERYSHVMHIVSGVTGTLKDGDRADRPAAGHVPARHCVWGSQGARHGDHRRTRAHGPRALRRGCGLHRLLGQCRHGDRLADACGRQRQSVGSGRCRHRRRQRSGGRVRGMSEQGSRRPRGSVGCSRCLKRQLRNKLQLSVSRSKLTL